MSQLLEYTKKNDKKSRKIIFGSELFEPNNEPYFRLYQKIDKNREKNRKIILGSEFSEAKNKPTFRLYQKIEKLFLGQNYLKRIMS